MRLPLAAASGPQPAKFVSESADVHLRLQAFLSIRDRDRRVACVRLEDQSDLWRLPGETLHLNEDPAAAGRRIGEMWFATPLAPRLVDIQSYPATGPDDNRWYLILVYEAEAPADLKGTPDTLEIRFVPPGKAPGEMYGDHASVLARLPP